MLSRCQFNNFLHHHVENIIGSCLESNNDQLMGHVLDECKLVTRILEAEKNSALSSELDGRIDARFQQRSRYSP